MGLRMKKEYHFDEICPYVKEVGLQKRDSWKQLSRKIYDHEICYCFMGTIHISINNEKYKITSGDLFIIPPDTPHIIWFEDDNISEMYWCHIDFFYFENRDWYKDFYDNLDTYVTLFSSELKYTEYIREDPHFTGKYQLPRVITIKNPDRIEYLFRMLHEEYLRNYENWRFSAKIYMLEILTIIIKQSNSKTFEMSAYNTIINKMKLFVSHNYYKKIRVNDVCRCTRLNTDYVSKIFKKYTGSTLIEYINVYRINEAKKLLINPNLSIVTIAEMVGFRDESYFCTVTKRIDGMTPAKIRSRLLNIIDT